jgi:hypothetical protein
MWMHPPSLTRGRRRCDDGELSCPRPSCPVFRPSCSLKSATPKRTHNSNNGPTQSAYTQQERQEGQQEARYTVRYCITEDAPKGHPR